MKSTTCNSDAPYEEGKFGKRRHSWELDCKGKERREHSGVTVRRI